MAGQLGKSGSSGNGGPATSALFNYLAGVAVDSSGNLFIADTENDVIRKVDHATGILSLYAGGGSSLGDGGPATSANFYYPESLTVDSTGDLIVADTNHERLRQINPTTGIIKTLAGSGNIFVSGDGGLATAADLTDPAGAAYDSSGNLFIVDSGDNRIREVNHLNGLISTFAGTGVSNLSGDYGAAVERRNQQASGGHHGRGGQRLHCRLPG